jgi:GNAT superfamily N-acetyltransferase
VIPTIHPYHELPVDLLADLVAESEGCGFHFVRRLVAEWASGANRFAAPGERLFAASIDGRVVGVCGLNVDPYATQPGVGRVRHLYVLSAYRRRGIGRHLIRATIDAAQDSFSRLRLRTDNPEATRFYENLGFRPCLGQADCSHVLELRVTEPKCAGSQP